MLPNFVNVTALDMACYASWRTQETLEVWGCQQFHFLDVPRLFLDVRRSKNSTNAPFICNHGPPDLGDGGG